jgi:hypothetical protein
MLLLVVVPSLLDCEPSEEVPGPSDCLGGGVMAAPGDCCESGPVPKVSVEIGVDIVVVAVADDSSVRRRSTVKP